MMLTAGEVAALLGLKPRTIYQLADSGALACYRMGGSGGAVRFDLADVEAYRQGCRSTRTRPPGNGASTSTSESSGRAAAASAFGGVSFSRFLRSRSKVGALGC